MFIDAYGALTGSGTVQMREYYFDEDLTCDSPFDVILDGGYDSSYNTRTGRAGTKGKLPVTGGSLTLAGLEIW